MVRVAEDVTLRPSRVIARREALVLLGAAGLTAVAAACAGDSGSAASGNGGRRGSSSSATKSGSGTSGSGSAVTTAPVASETTVACVLTPETTEGPYYIDDALMRSDVTEGRPGTPLQLTLTVATINGSSCRPLAGASVDIWHADASGNYSGFGNTESNKTFLRGVQTTDARGIASFRTIYPGWYPGRAVHVHVKVHAGGTDLHTGQLFFDDSVSESVFAAAPYTAGNRWQRNAQDGIFNNGGGAQTIVELARDGTGYAGAMTLGVRA